MSRFFICAWLYYNKNMKCHPMIIASAFLLFSCTNGADRQSTNPTTTSSTEKATTSSVLSSEEASSQKEASSSPSVEQKDPMGEPYIGRQYYLNHIGDIYSAWNSYRGDGVTIAVIDVGFNPYHEDFSYEDGTSKVSPKSAAFHFDGTKVVKTEGIQAVENMVESHGTFCAGVAAAAVNGKGVAGVAPNASLLLIKVDSHTSSISEAFRYAADCGAKVVTISIGAYNNDPKGELNGDIAHLYEIFDAPVAYCRSKGTVVVSAGGNGGKGNATEYTYPGATTGVIGVGGLAANSSGEIWEGSSYNSSSKYQFCDVFAPSDMMFGCCNYLDGTKYDGGWDGTSFASPQVAGIAALYFQKYPSKTPADFENALFKSCHKITTSQIATADQLGYGRVDVGALLGVTAPASIKVSVTASWQNVNCYAWNLEQQAEMRPWPGEAMKKENGKFVLTINPNQYDSIIFSNPDSVDQTVDLLSSSFASGKSYVIGDLKERSRTVGSYR